jgi:hypothetical protein
MVDNASRSAERSTCAAPDNPKNCFILFSKASCYEAASFIPSSASAPAFTSSLIPLHLLPKSSIFSSAFCVDVVN